MIRFLNPAALLLSFSVVIPILFHFYERVRAREQVLPTLSLLQRAEERIRHSPTRFLILILRCLILLTIALLFSSPVYIPVRGGKPPRTIIVLDNGPYMARRKGGQNLLEEARRAALACYRRSIDSGEVHCRALHPYPEEGRGTGIEALRSARVTVWKTTLRRLARLISRITRGRFEKYRLVFFSGGDRSFWNERVRLPIQIEYRRIETRKIGNAAITGIGGLPAVLFSGRQYLLTIHIDNFNSVYSRNYLSVYLDGVPVVKRQLALLPGKRAYGFRIRSDRPGDLKLRIRLRGDEFRFDNELVHQLFVLDKLPVYFYPPLGRNPYLRASLKAIVGSSFIRTLHPGKSLLQFGVISGRQKEMVLRSSSPAILFSPPGYTGSVSTLRLLDETGTVALVPTGLTNTVQHTRYFPDSLKPLRASFTGSLRWQIRSSLPGVSLFRTETGVSRGILLTREQGSVAIIPFYPSAEDSGLFFDRAYPVFISELFARLLRKESPLSAYPDPAVVRSFKSRKKWSGVFFRHGDLLFAANIKDNCFRNAAHPEDGWIRNATGSRTVAVSEADEEADSATSFSTMLVLLILLFKAGELFLVQRAER